MKAANLEHRLEEKMKSSSSSKAILSSDLSKKKTLWERQSFQAHWGGKKNPSFGSSINQTKLWLKGSIKHNQTKLRLKGSLQLRLELEKTLRVPRSRHMYKIEAA